MNILITTFSQTPIYEQIREQLKEEILKGRIQAGEQLPSIRLMATDLKVGIITVKRAYEELEKEGMIINVQGKGCFVQHLDYHRVHELHCEMLKDQMQDIQSFCREHAITKEEATHIFERLWCENDE